MFSKSECLRLKGICEPLEDIITRHYSDIYSKYMTDEELSLEEKDLEALENALDTIRELERKNWNALLHQNDKLDV